MKTSVKASRLILGVPVNSGANDGGLSLWYVREDIVGLAPFIR